ncbi:MAG TPA: response regulator [Longimicrobium sp.]|nr:response regulator [Longimicrobium sp.]
MRQILLAGLPPRTGEWLAYRLRGETVEVLFSADDLIQRLEVECAPSLVVLSACGSADAADREVQRVRAACGPDVPIVVEVDAGQTSVSPGVLGRLMHGHGVRRVVPSSASRGDLLAAVLAFLPEAAPPRPPARRTAAAAPAVPVRRFPDRLAVDAPAAAPQPQPAYRVPPPPRRIEVPFGGVYGFSAAAPSAPAVNDDYGPLVLLDTSLHPVEPAPPASAEPAPLVLLDASPQGEPRELPASVPAINDDPAHPRPRVMVLSADGALVDAFAAAAGADYEVRVGTFAELLRIGRDDEGAPAAVLVDVPQGQGERVWRLLDRIGRRLPRVPVLVATTSDGLDDRVNAVRVGARACIQKPVAPETARDVLASALPPRVPAAPRVLVVDDDADVLRSAEELFGRLGWEVRTVAEPAEVWQALASARPDLLILDSDLPGIDGLDLCRALRSDPRWRRLPVLFLTATTDVPWLYRAYAAGADDHVAKPFWGPELVSRARNRLRRLEVACV